MDITNAGVMVTAIIGAVQFLKAILPDKIEGPITVVVAVVLGALAGYFGIGAPDIVTGATLGASAVGSTTLVGKIVNK